MYSSITETEYYIIFKYCGSNEKYQHIQVLSSGFSFCKIILINRGEYAKGKN